MAYQSPSTFLSLQTKISKKIIDAAQTAVSESDVGDALNDALRYWKFKRFWFNEAQTTLAMDPTGATDGSTTSDPYVLGYGNTKALFPNAPILPQNFLYEFQKDGFTINYSKLTYRFEKLSPAAYDDANIQGVGIPYIYCFRNGNYEFYFYPNLAYSLIVNYVMDVLDFANPGDTNVFTQYADRLIMYEAISHLIGEDRQDPTMDNIYAKKAEREYRLLKKRGNGQVATGTLTVSSILD